MPATRHSRPCVRAITRSKSLPSDTRPRLKLSEVMPSTSTYNVYMYLQPEGAADNTNVPPSGTTMTPKLQSEIDKAVTKMRRQQFDDARQHFEKAAKMAPGNPDVQYMWGMLEYYQQHFDLARTKFETAVSINPNHERALVSLGEIQLRDKQSAQAVQTLEKAFLVNGADWRMHYLLAFAYADERNFAKAETHAQRAADLGGKDHSPQARVLLGRILSAEGKVSGGAQRVQCGDSGFPGAIRRRKMRRLRSWRWIRPRNRAASDSRSQASASGQLASNAAASSRNGNASTADAAPAPACGFDSSVGSAGHRCKGICRRSGCVVLARHRSAANADAHDETDRQLREIHGHRTHRASGHRCVRKSGKHQSRRISPISFLFDEKNRERCCWMKSATAAKI